LNLGVGLHIGSVYLAAGQKHCWSYFAFSRTRLVKMVTWQIRKA